MTVNKPPGSDSHRIRRFGGEASDYEAIAALHNAVWPDMQRTAGEMKHDDDAQEPGVLYQRFVVPAGGSLAAMGLGSQPWWSRQPGKFFVSVEVHPEYRNRGIGGALYDHITEFLSDSKPVKLTAVSREDQPEGQRFLEKRGFERVMRDQVSRLLVDRFNPAEFSRATAKAEAMGIAILPLSELQASEPDWKRKLEALEWELLQDLPSPDPVTRIPFEVYEERMLGSPNFLPEGQFIALDGEDWIGVSALWKTQANARKLETGLTGVKRSHRRKGIATALKVRAIEFARSLGVVSIETENEENNPMYQLNLKLGFEPQPAWLVFQKKLEQGEGGPEQSGA